MDFLGGKKGLLCGSIGFFGKIIGFLGFFGGKNGFFFGMYGFFFGRTFLGLDLYVLSRCKGAIGTLIGGEIGSTMIPLPIAGGMIPLPIAGGKMAPPLIPIPPPIGKPGPGSTSGAAIGPTIGSGAIPAALIMPSTV